jgi:uncharacterized protein
MIEKIKDQLLRNGSVKFKVKIIPKSSRNEIVGELTDDILKIKLTAAPEKNKANTALIKFLAKTLNIANHNVQIISGHTSQKKIIEIIS